MNSGENNDLPLFREDYKSAVVPYHVRLPGIRSGAEYYFETGSGLKYQVLFAKKKDNYLEHIVNFGVLSDEFEDEYGETNRGEIFRVMATVVEIIRIFHENHSYSTSYEFSGEFRESEDRKKASIRTRLYLRKALEIINSDWEIGLSGNRVTVTRKKRWK
jgi:hypothetical protein